MDERYRRYNEVTFVQYCMTSIDRAVKHACREKQVMAQREISLTALDNMEVSILSSYEGINEADIPEAMFEVDGLKIPIVNAELARALTCLPPQKRTILLLAYFIGDTDTELSRTLNISKSAAQRKRTATFNKLQELMISDENDSI